MNEYNIDRESIIEYIMTHAPSYKKTKLKKLNDAKLIELKVEIKLSKEKNKKGKNRKNNYRNEYPLIMPDVFF